MVCAKVWHHVPPPLTPHPDHLRANSARKCFIWPAEYGKEKKNSNFHAFSLNKHSQFGPCLLFLSFIISFPFFLSFFTSITLLDWPLKALEFGLLQSSMVPRRKEYISQCSGAWCDIQKSRHACYQLHQGYLSPFFNIHHQHGLSLCPPLSQVDAQPQNQGEPKQIYTENFLHMTGVGKGA